MSARHGSFHVLPSVARVRSALAEALRDKTLTELARVVDVPTEQLQRFLTDWTTSPAEELQTRCYVWFFEHAKAEVQTYPIGNHALPEKLQAVARDLQAAEFMLRNAIQQFLAATSDARLHTALRTVDG